MRGPVEYFSELERRGELEEGLFQTVWVVFYSRSCDSQRTYLTRSLNKLFHTVTFKVVGEDEAASSGCNKIQCSPSSSTKPFGIDSDGPAG